MREIAAWIIVVAALTWFIIFVGNMWPGANNDWWFTESPTTGICYELHDYPLGFGYGVGMSPVDDSYCEEAE